MSEYAKRVEYLHIMLQPLVDVYTFTILSLKGLVGQSLSEKDLIQKILNDIKTNIDHDIIKYSK